METSIILKLFESAKDAVFITDSNGLILWCNCSVTEMYEWERDALIGLFISFLFPLEQRLDFEELLHDILRYHERKSIIVKRNTRSGRLVTVSTSISPIYNSSDKIIGLSFIEKFAKSVLDPLEGERFDELLNQLLDPVLLLNSKGEIQDVNKQTEVLFGYSREELITRNIKFLIPEKFYNDYPSHFHEVSSKQQKTIKGVDMALQAKKKDGTLFPMEITLSPLQHKRESMVSAIVRDITTRKSFERQLRESEQRFRALVDVAIDSIITTDENGLILSYNMASEIIFGYPREYIEGKNIRLLLADPTKVDFVQILLDSGKTEVFDSSKKYHKFDCKRENGDVFIAEVSIGSTPFDEKPFYILILRDITDQEKVNKLKSEFVSTVSHELRTPLTSISGSISLILKGVAGPLTPDMEKLIELAHRNSDRLILLINDILDVQKIEENKMVFDIIPVDLAKLIPQIISSDRVYAEKFHVTVDCQIPFTSLVVNTDEQRLTQVITNLVSNAIKFSSQNGLVIVKMEHINDLVRISVIDNGIGIPKQFQSKLFEKFFQVDSSDKRKRGGTGLGLAIAKMIIQNLGGSIGFTSKEGKGSTFWVELGPVQSSSSSVVPSQQMSASD